VKRKKTKDGFSIKDSSVAQPTGITVDDAGTIYYSETGKRALRKIDKNSIVTTVAGNGAEDLAGKSGLAKETPLIPGPIAYRKVKDEEIIYVVHNWFGVYIAKVTLGEYPMVNTISGSGSRGFGGDTPTNAHDSEWHTPSSIATDSHGNLWAVDKGNQRIRKIEYGSNELTTVIYPRSNALSPNPLYWKLLFSLSNEFPASTFPIDSPKHIFIDKKDRIFFYDDTCHCIVQYDPTAALPSPSLVLDTLVTPPVFEICIAGIVILLVLFIVKCCC